MYEWIFLQFYLCLLPLALTLPSSPPYQISLQTSCGSPLLVGGDLTEKRIKIPAFKRAVTEIRSSQCTMSGAALMLFQLY